MLHLGTTRGLCHGAATPLGLSFQCEATLRILGISHPGKEEAFWYKLSERLTSLSPAILLLESTIVIMWNHLAANICNIEFLIENKMGKIQSSKVRDKAGCIHTVENPGAAKDAVGEDYSRTLNWVRNSSWKKKTGLKQCVSITHQILLSVYCVHCTGFRHMDTGMGKKQPVFHELIMFY